MRERLGTLLALSFLLTGCSVTTVGEPEYSCAGIPDGVSCMSARDVYEATEYTDQVGASKIASSSPTAVSAQGGEGDVHKIALPVDRYPKPIRRPAQVMRMWIGPWRDRQDALHMPNKIYKEVTPRSWTIGSTAPY